MELWVRWQPKFLTLKPAILISVIVLCSNPLANNDAKILIEREISGVEDAVNVATEQQAVGDRVFAATAVRLNMRRLQGG